MDTKSSEESLIETEPMETSTGVDTPLLGKRKLEETDDQEDSDEDEEEEEEEEEGSDFYWEKDSFDGREYHPSDDSEYSDEDLQEKSTLLQSHGHRNQGFL
uniref:Uncharacterized protein n=1 Tax=Brassica campestris TaxID=3711 RepID=A0A3P5ZMM8_BRACM|nr:unnamed protein product [Brassica rapa]